MREPRREALACALEHVRHLLPVQGPIGVFVHHNTLHAFQHLPFERAVLEGLRTFGAEPYLAEARYREELARGRIGREDLAAELTALAAARGPAPRDLPPGVEREGLWRLLLELEVTEVDGAALRWHLDEGGRRRRLRDDLPPGTRRHLVGEASAWLEGLARGGEAGALGEALAGEADPARAGAAVERVLGLPLDAETIRLALWKDPEPLATAALWAACQRRARAPAATAPAPVRLRDRLLLLTGEDADERVHPVLIRWCAAQLDQGIAYWPLPGRGRGLLRAFAELAGQGGAIDEPFLTGLRPELRAIAARPGPGAALAEEVVSDELARLGLPEAAWTEYVERTLLALPGWAGMVSLLERRPELAPAEDPRATLLELLALRLLLERHALGDIARRHLGPEARLDALPAPPPPDPVRARERAAWRLFELCQLLGVAAPALLGWSDDGLAALERELEAFGPVERRRVWHLAYERHHRDRVCAAIAANRARGAARPRGADERSDVQALFCIDDRSEGIRRHLEEVAPAVETFGGAGFFGLAIAFRGLDDARPAELCPVLIRPEHDVRERAVAADSALEASRRRRRRFLAQVARGSTVGSLALVRGLVATTILGLLATVPLVVRTVFPRLAARLSRWLTDLVLPRPRTELTGLREDEGALGETGRKLGFTVEEAAARVARLLEDTGIAAAPGRLVLVVGHGSSSVNNPHFSAYDCGACGGRPGAPNARLFARLANDPRVRAAARERGCAIPDDTWFVGAFHDTCVDALHYFDVERVPPGQRGLLARTQEALDRARRLSAHERCRRFESAPARLTPDEALRHVEHRGAHLAEPRPEYNHGTNAVCVVGRRALTRGLFLDRRAFLVSYDPALDEDGRVLTRILAAIGPVGAGINLEYYFSTVDNERYGCGTKLPHNITSMLGVMNGHQSDLRTGLPYQTLDIHEPVRLLMIVEATPETLVEVTRRDREVAELVLGQWVQLVSVDPLDGTLRRFTGAGFEPYAPPAAPLPVVRASRDWYAGRREHLPPALVLGPGGGEPC